MRSHTVPRKLLEQFAFYDPGTKSKRLWTYEKNLPPYMSSPKSATRWNGQFADPRVAAKEEELEKRLQREIEQPVNEFLELMKYSAFVLSLAHTRKLTRYITLLFHRSRARLGATQHLLDKMLGSMRTLLANDEQLQAIADKVTVDLLVSGVRLERNATKGEIAAVLMRTIEQHEAADQLQHNYAKTVERMLSFEDEDLQNANWDILRTEPENPFVIGDAPVVTWENYDTAYTERYLGMPDTDAAAYDAASLLTMARRAAAAGGPPRKLLVIHGTADDNVWFLNGVKLVDALSRAHLPFEFLPLAGTTHMLLDPDLSEEVWLRTAQVLREGLR